MTEAVHTHATVQRRNGLMLLVGAVWVALVTIGLIALSRADFLPEGPDEWTYDWRTLLFSPTAETPRSDIAIILIDETSMADYDYISPVDRGLMASLLRSLDRAQPKVIGLDFIYDRHSEESKTQDLIASMRSANVPLVFGAVDRRIRGFTEENLNYQDDFIARTGRDAGHVFFAHEKKSLRIGDQVVRYMGERAPGSPFRKSLAELIAEKAGRSPAEPATPYISWLLPPAGTDLFPLFRIPRHRPGSPPGEILPASWQPALKDRIVLIGGDFVNRDKHLTPLSIWDGAKIPGVMIQAQILAQLLDGRSLYTLPADLEILLLALVGFLGFFLSWNWQIKRYEWLVYIAGLGGLILVGIILFSAFSIIAPSTTLFFAWTLGVTGGHYAPRLLRKTRLAG